MKFPLSLFTPLSGVDETRVVFGHWPPSEGTPARLGGATHVLVSSPAGTAVGKVSVPQHLSVVEEEANKNKPVRNDGAPETVGGGKGEEEDGPQGKLEYVEEVGRQGERVLVSTTEGDAGSVETQLDIGETSRKLAEAEPSEVPCSEPLVVVCAEASKDCVGPYHQVKTAWEEGAKTPPSDHEIATTTSQHADCGPGRVEVLDIEIIDPHAANLTESETRSPGSKLPDSNPLNFKPPDPNTLDSNPPNSKPLDSKPPDSNPLDSNPPDSNPLDSNPPDSKPPDSKPLNSNSPDSNPLDFNPPDSNPLDSNPPDSNTLDSNPPNFKPLDSNPPNSKPLDSDKARQEEEEKFWTSAGSLMPQVRRL